MSEPLTWRPTEYFDVTMTNGRATLTGRACVSGGSVEGKILTWYLTFDEDGTTMTTGDYCDGLTTSGASATTRVWSRPTWSTIGQRLADRAEVAEAELADARKKTRKAKRRAKAFEKLLIKLTAELEVSTDHMASLTKDNEAVRAELCVENKDHAHTINHTLEAFFDLAQRNLVPISNIQRGLLLGYDLTAEVQRRKKLVGP